MGQSTSTEQLPDPEAAVSQTPVPQTPDPKAADPQSPDPEAVRPKPQAQGINEANEVPKQGCFEYKVKKKRSKLTNQESHERRVDPHLEDVKTKIRKAYPKMGDNEVCDLAECLCDKEKFKEKYFKPLLRRLDAAVEVTFGEAEVFSQGYPNDRTKQKSERRMVQGTDRVKSLDVELLLYELKGGAWQTIARYFHEFVKECTYGPYHAALKIGNLILEWDTDSLIIPYEGEPEDFTAVKEPAATTLIFRANVHETAGQSEIDIPTRGGAEATTKGFQEHANHLLDITAEKEYLLDALADVIVRYNTKFDYGTFSCNCQYFVAETLSALGVEDKAEHFRRITKDVFAEILLKRRDKASEFNTHAELDDHVRDKIETMDREDLQFCHCHYLLFHAWNKRSPKTRAWQCDDSRCMSREVARRIPQ